MSQINDCKLNALTAAFGKGQLNDLMLKFLQANGATSNNINDAWLEVAGGGVGPVPPVNGLVWYDFRQFQPEQAIQFLASFISYLRFALATEKL